MFCDVCDKRNAVINVTRVINGQKSIVNLCESCANKYTDGFTIGSGEYSFDNFLSKIINSNPYSVGQMQTTPETDSCPTCGLSYQNYQDSGRLGCWNCYRHFSPRLEPIFKKIHGSTHHQGKRLEKSVGDADRIRVNLEDKAKATGVELKLQNAVDPVEQELEQLKAELQAKVDLEEFETAAILRDQIKEIEAKTGKKTQVNGNE